MLAVRERALGQPAEGPRTVQGLFAGAQDFLGRELWVDHDQQSQASDDQWWHWFTEF